MTKHTKLAEVEKKEPIEEAKIETAKGKRHYMDVGPGALAVDLPCGYIDPDGKHHQTLVVTEMTGYEEDILAGKGPIVPRLNHIISNCTKQFGDISKKATIRMAVAELTAIDRMAALITIRRVSLGDAYDVKVTCPSSDCKEISNFSLDLSEVEMIEMPNQLERVTESTLASGKIVKWHIMTAKDEEWLTKKQKRKEDMLTLAMMSRVDAIDDYDLGREQNYKTVLAKLKSLTMKERTEIRELFEGAEGKVDTDVEFECPVCGYEWKADMDVGQASFFFPSAT